MGQLPFPPDVELTVPDRMVLNLLQKRYEACDVPKTVGADLADDSDDSTSKISQFVVPSPEGNFAV